jgi:hypothetical protein
MNLANPPVWAFSARLMMEIVNASHLPAGKDFKTTTYLYNRRGEREGVFAKGLKMKDKVIVKRLAFDGDNWEAVATVPSESDPNTTYTVKLYLPLDFECGCPWGSHRFRPCKHVYAAVIKLFEVAGADVRDPILWHFVFEGLSRLAYHKAKTSRRLA